MIKLTRALAIALTVALLPAFAFAVDGGMTFGGAYVVDMDGGDYNYALAGPLDHPISADATFSYFTIVDDGEVVSVPLTVTMIDAAEMPSVPEPGTAAMCLLGFASIAAVRKLKGR
jgi:hypothetical protein